MVHEPTAGIEAALVRWEEAGLLSAEQSVAISVFEATRDEGQQTTATSRDELSLTSELGVYLGMVLVVASGALATSRLWGSLGTPGRAAIGIVVVALSLVGSQMLRGELSGSLTRLRHVLEAAGAAGAAMSTAVVVDWSFGHNATTTVLITGLVVALINGAQWRNQERTLAFLGVVAGLAMVGSATFNALDWTLSPLTGALVLLLLGTLAMVGANSVLHPRLVTTIGGQGLLFFGASLLTSDHALLGFAVGLLAAGSGVALGIRTKMTPVTAMGLFSFAYFTIRLLAMYVRGPLAIVITFLLGVGVVILVLRKSLARKNNKTAEHHRSA